MTSKTLLGGESAVSAAVNQSQNGISVWVINARIYEDLLTDKFGSTWLIDSLYMYAMTPLNLVGLLLNMFSLLILFDKEFIIPLRQYFLVYSANSALLVNSVYLFQFLARTPRINSRFSTRNKQIQTFQANFVTPVAITGYFFGSVLDVLLCINRIGFFNKSIKARLPELNPYLSSLAGLVVCIGINFPYYFVYQSSSVTVTWSKSNFTGQIFYNSTLNNQTDSYFRLYYTDLSRFATHTAGLILTLTIYFVRDILLMFVEIVLSLIVLYYLEAYYCSKIKNHPSKDDVYDDLNSETRVETNHVNRRATSLGSEYDLNRNSSSISSSSTSLQFEAISMKNIPPAGPTHPRLSDVKSKKAMSTYAQTSLIHTSTKMYMNNKDLVMRRERKTSAMVVVMCFVTILEHFLFSLSLVYPYLYYFDPVKFAEFDSVFSRQMSLVAELFISFKHGINFVLFFSFNRRFRRSSVKYIRKLFHINLEDLLSHY